MKYFTVFEPFSTFCHFCEAWQENFSRADQISVTALQKCQTSSLYDSGQFCTLQRKNSRPSSQLFHRSTDKQLPPRPGRMSRELIRLILPWRALAYRWLTHQELGKSPPPQWGWSGPCISRSSSSVHPSCWPMSPKGRFKQMQQ